MARLIAILAGVLGLFFGMASQASAAAIPAQCCAAAYAYNDPDHSLDGPTAQAERGPPAAFDRDTTHGAVDRWSRGASACSDQTVSRAVTTYDDTARPVSVALATRTAQEQDEADDRALTSLAPRFIAAKAEVPTVVFSRSRAPGIAGTFGDAVANGAPTQLNRVGTAARDANRRAALRGQSPAPAGQSLDEYPFACSAQGGCGATVRSVPVGEQSCQGGVLSRFFQDNGIGVGDPFNVMFGP